MRVASIALVLVLAECAVSTPAQAQERETAALLRRVAVSAQRFVNQFSNVVSEEVYEQRFSVNARRRRLKSEFLLVAYPGDTKHVMTFRDIHEVDGKPLGDQTDRIPRLFLQPFDNAVRRAQEIHREGLKFSLETGRLMDPLTVIGYLQPEYQGNFRVSRGGVEKSLGVDIREISLTPTASRARTLLKPARAWVSEGTGSVVKTELRSGFGTRAEITTTVFGVDRTLNISVPIEMRDEVPRGRDDFIGVATYSNFRRFEVRAETVVDVPQSKP